GIAETLVIERLGRLGSRPSLYSLAAWRVPPRLGVRGLRSRVRDRQSAGREARRVRPACSSRTQLAANRGVARSVDPAGSPTQPGIPRPRLRRAAVLRRSVASVLPPNY